MTNVNDSIQSHYTVAGLGQTILNALQALGKDPDALTLEDLAPIDEFHIRGRESTTELARLAGVISGCHVLDVGSGLGGSARYIASEFDCTVTGLDLTREYCQVATMLSRLIGMDGQTRFQHGSALDLPFASESFDLVWTEHTQMNISDKKAFYSGICRVLKPGGRLAFHDVFQGSGGDIHYPVPWAGESSISSVVLVPQLKRELQSLGLRTLHWEDVTQRSLEWFRIAMRRPRPQGPAPLRLQLLMGADFALKFQNMVRNLDEDRVAVVLAVLEKPA